MGRDLNTAEKATLEGLIDAAGLCAVLQSLSEICDAKADHIRASYETRDTPLVLAWRTAAGKLGLAACERAVMAIGEP